MGSIAIDHAVRQASQLYQQNRLDQAAVLCSQILAIDPNQIETLNLAALLALAKADYSTAERHLQKALSIEPDSVYTQNNMGIVLYQLNRFAQAAEMFASVLKKTPDNPSALNNFGESLNHLNRYEEALACSQKAVAIAPDLPGVHQTLGVTCVLMGRYEEALRHYEKAISLAPDDSSIHVYRATTLLVMGNFAEGWKEYEHRRFDQNQAVFAASASAPLWDGGPLDGKTILVHAEQGFGDNIQFVRYLEVLRQRGAKVIYQCRSGMRQLFSNLEYATVITRDDPIPSADVQCRLMSLPYLCRTTLETVPNKVPYLKADQTKSGQWNKRLAGISGRRIGLVWAGNPGHSNDARRSMQLQELLPLLDIPEITFFTLQLGPAAEQATALPRSTRWVDWTAELTDFADTAALIDNFDLVISVDTAVAHLAGALGKQVWTMLPFSPEFRWLLNRSDTPWYPTMKLFRQSRPGDWASIISEVKKTLLQMQNE